MYHYIVMFYYKGHSMLTTLPSPSAQTIRQSVPDQEDIIRRSLERSARYGVDPHLDGAPESTRLSDEQLRERRGNTIITRSLRVYSLTLGLTGQCDVVEFHRDERGVPLHGYEGTWLPFPVEYKRGRAKQDGCDELQLCAQAMCLEEMLCCEIPQGALYYGEPHRRTEVDFTPELRQEVTDLLTEMHELYRRGYTPKVKPSKSCNACSLKELCLPKLLRSRSVSAYLRGAMEDEP